MTEEQLIATLKQLIDDQRSAIADNNWTAKGPYTAYHAAMMAVVDRYRATNPYASVPQQAVNIVNNASDASREAQA